MPRSRLSLPSFLSAPRIPRFPSFRLPMLAPLLASALAMSTLATMTACASAPANAAPHRGEPAPRSSGAAGAASAASAGEPQIDDSLTGVIDEPAPPWTVSQWFNSPPLTLESLRGKVVLVRWFMGPSCPFCSATAPTLRTLHDRYAARGLTVVGMYHHKEETPLDPEQVGGWVEQYGYTFPVAIDKDWTTLDRWWLGGRQRPFTSVSFLIDKAGVVRRVHLGGTLAEGAELDAMTADIERLMTI
jgi:peroxiredoxin